MAASQLPLDGLALVFAALDAPDLLTVALVCRTWSSAEAASRSVLWARQVPHVPPPAAKEAYLCSTAVLLTRERLHGTRRAWLVGPLEHTRPPSAAIRVLNWLRDSQPLAGFREMLDALAPRRFHVLLIGPEAAGKTACIDTLVSRSQAYAERPTGQLVVEKAFVGGSEIILVEPPIQRSRRAGRMWLDEVGLGEFDGVAFVADVAYGERAQETARMLHEEILTASCLQRLPLLILANKQDLSSASRPSSHYVALRVGNVRARRWRLQGCTTVRANIIAGGGSFPAGSTGMYSPPSQPAPPCAHDVHGINSGFMWLAQEMRQRVHHDHLQSQDDFAPQMQLPLQMVT
jgi:ADP-ribosylation factor-like protein 3